MKIRKPAVAGTFYPATSSAITKMIEGLYIREKENIPYELAGKHMIGGITPHAGYQFSGNVAVNLFGILKEEREKFDTIIIMNPNHQGIGPELSTDDSDSWWSPLGSVALDREMIDALEFEISPLSYQHEHAAEVILPFLQFFLSYDFRIIPVSFLRQDPEISVKIAGRIVEVNKILNRKLLLLASSDFSHYVPAEIGEAKDRKIIDDILRFDINSVFDHINDLNASVCGYGPIMTLIRYTKMVTDSPGARLLKFGNSGGGKAENPVVDYASILFFED